MPSFEVRERHSITIRRPPGQVLESLAELRLEDMPLARFLFFLRSLPARLSGRPASSVRTLPLLERFRTGGAVVLGEEPGREILVGLVGRFWRLRGGGWPSLRDASDFERFVEPGYAKAVINFEVRERDGLTTLATETRVSTTDDASRKVFRRYWRVIGLGSAITRRSMLRAVRRRAERSSLQPNDT